MTKNIGYVVLVNESGEPFIAHKMTPGGFLIQHKPDYVAKVRNGQYTRYFYSDDEYQAYLRNKSKSKGQLKMRDQYNSHMSNASGVSGKLEKHRTSVVGRPVEKMSDEDLEKESERLSDEWKKMISDGTDGRSSTRKTLANNARRRFEIYVEQAVRNYRRTGKPDAWAGQEAYEGFLDEDLYDKVLESGLLDAWDKKYNAWKYR